jgi:hypothetical protein
MLLQPVPPTRGGIDRPKKKLQRCSRGVDSGLGEQVTIQVVEHRNLSRLRP